MSAIPVDPSHVDPAHFEAKYRRAADPWDYESSVYEQEKYARTLAAIGPGPFPRALELGCSVGVFTALLAPRCTHLLAVDGAPTALARARARLATPGRTNVAFELRTLPHELPDGRFDLIVASELLYYWTADLLAATLPRIEHALARGGRLVAVHWRGRLSDGRLDGDGVHTLLHERMTLDHGAEHVTAAYRLDAFDRPSA
ncbi:MAG: Methyltransferase type 12 [Conexibacter sp.]|jgi:SAM-dependent methyltransferase|nr:Methyltransferase type 12 [Conexibacter sp.]